MESDPRSVLSGGGACGALMRATDWSRTPVGPVEQWPRSLGFAVQTVLSSRYPMLLLWGDELTQLYNDAYAQLIGDQHPAAMGGDVRVTLAAGWDVLGPIVGQAVQTGVASWVPALQLLLERSGYREEAHFSVSHAPARDDDGRTVGVLTVCSEVTDAVVSERRLRVLRDLSLRSGQTLDVASCLEQLDAALRDHPLDLPLAAVYLADAGSLRRALAVGQDAAGAPVGEHLPVRAGDEDDVWGLASAARGATVDRVVPAGTVVPGGPFDDTVRTVVALPLPSAGDAPLGVLLVGVSPSRALDEGYRSFLEVLGEQVAAALRKARAYEDERRRAEVLAELDRAKTDFFTNVSHEFRTPLTLLLGPLEDALRDDEQGVAPLSQEQRERLGTAHRNAQRLLRLVNDLLTFSSLEAGRTGAAPRPVDLAAATAEHASAFRSAVERAGLELVVDCPPLPRPVRLDPEQWETVVTNLLSNALKFTFVGSIRVTLRSDASHVVLEVADTGIGIAEQDRSRLFERFGRVTGARGRSHEGSGIGLALVDELTRLHGGEVGVDSEQGRGTTFRLTFPWSALADGPEGATATGPASAPGSSGAGLRARAAAAEADQWLDTDAAAEPRPQRTGAGSPELAGARVLVADDNRDLRDYLVRLLREAGCEVTAVADGEQALRHVRDRLPDLLLTDVMMPGVDGLELLRRVRADPALRTLPVVVLSARAGAEAGVEGLDLGADDYLVKPFRADELLSRVRTTLRMARLRSAHRAELVAVAEATAVLHADVPVGDALLEVVEQARALVAARRVQVVLEPVPGRAAVSASSPDGPADGPPDLVLAVPGAPSGQAPALGRLEVWAGPQPLRTELLPPLRAVLQVLAESGSADRDREVAATLQRSLLPDRLPQVPGLDLAASYRPGARGVQVGGDWYDVLPLPDGRVAVSVGDAAGRGLKAASAMGQLRSALRAYVLQGWGPAKSLAELDAFCERLGTTTFATVWLGYLAPATGELTWCSAGHLPPLLLVPGGDPVPLDGEVWPPLGAFDGADARTVLPDGASLLLYTDGLVEDRTTQLDDGPRRLLSCLVPVPSSARTTVDAALRARTADAEDDVTVLAVRRVPQDTVDGPDLLEVDRTFRYPAALEAAGLARRDLRLALASAGVPEDDAFALLLAVSEAVNNAVEHAQSPASDEVAVRLAVGGGCCRLEVQDSGTWRGRPAAMDRGRGAALMAAAGEVRVTPSTSGTTVAIERSWA